MAKEPIDPRPMTERTLHERLQRSLSAKKSEGLVELMELTTAIRQVARIEGKVSKSRFLDPLWKIISGRYRVIEKRAARYRQDFPSKERMRQLIEKYKEVVDHADYPEVEAVDLLRTMVFLIGGEEFRFISKLMPAKKQKHSQRRVRTRGKRRRR